MIVFSQYDCTNVLPCDDDVIREARLWAEGANADDEYKESSKTFEFVCVLDPVGVLLRNLDPTSMHALPMLGGMTYVGDTSVDSSAGSSPHCVVDSLLGRIVEYRSLDKHRHIGADLMSKSLMIEFF